MKKIVFILGLFLMGMVCLAQEHQTIEEIEVMPPSCKSELFKYNAPPKGMVPFNFYMQDHLQQQAKIADFMNGKVILDFVVHEDGSLSDFAIRNSVSRTNDNAVIAAIKSTDGYWNPGLNNGTPTAMEKRIVISFYNSEIGSLLVQARRYLHVGIKKYYAAERWENSLFVSQKKQDRKVTRKLNTALANLNIANRLYGQAPSVLLYQHKVYKKLGDDIKAREKEMVLDELIAVNKAKFTDYLAVAF